MREPEHDVLSLSCERRKVELDSGQMCPPVLLHPVLLDSVLGRNFLDGISILCPCVVRVAEQSQHQRVVFPSHPPADLFRTASVSSTRT